MSGFDVVRDGMPNRLISDAAIEALIAGEPVVGTPESLWAFVASLRELAQGGPSVPMSGRLLEFLVDGSPAGAPLTAIQTGQTSEASSRRTGRLAGKAAAVLALIPAHLLVGATIAAAALGSAQAFGFVDVPLLPDPGPPVETLAPVELPPVDTPPTDSTVAPAVAATPPGAAVPAENQTRGSFPDTDTPTARERPESPARQPVSSTLPRQAAVGGKPGCELGEQAAAQSAQPPAQRPTPVTSDVTPAVEPCDRKPSEDDAVTPDAQADRGNESGDDRSQDSPPPGRGSGSGTEHRATSAERHGIRQGRTPAGG